MAEEKDTSEKIENQERYADELAGPDDYWLTITDAARATRRQDVSIRRWISKGLLPVRRQHVGLNQRTRLVRASDLAALTPIIDPAGAISSERGKLDLTGIPKQQAEIRASQQDILCQIDALQRQVQETSDTVRGALVTQETKVQEALASLRSEMFTRQQQQQTDLLLLQHELDVTMDSLRGEWERNIQALAKRTTSSISELKHHVLSLSADFQSLSTSWQDVTQQQQADLDSLQSSLQQEAGGREQLEQQIIHLNKRLAQQNAAYAQEAQEREKQVAQLTTRLSQQQIACAYLNQVQSSLMSQLEELGAHLTKQQTALEQERATRAKFEQLVLRLTVRLHEQEKAQQLHVASLSEQQEHIASLQRRLDEQARHVETVLQYYVKLHEPEGQDG